MSHSPLYNFPKIHNVCFLNLIHYFIIFSPKTCFHSSDQKQRNTIKTTIRPQKIQKNDHASPLICIILQLSRYFAYRNNEKIPRHCPLVLYVFTSAAEIQELFVNNTRAGSMCLNDTVMQYAGKRNHSFVDLVVELLSLGFRVSVFV